jgi:uncharacterized protein YcaQ
LLPAPLKVPTETARRFHRRALLLDGAAATIPDVLAHHGYVQIDPINMCGRMHDHILRNRVAGYREGDLMRFLHGPPRAGEEISDFGRRTSDAKFRTVEEKRGATPARTAFEHHLPDTNVLVAFGFEAWPHLLAAMQRRTRRIGAWSGKLTPRERALAERILGEIAERGPLSADQIDDKRRSRQMIWGSFSLAKSTLQKLFFHGRVLIARREHNRRVYDLPERILPAEVLALPEPTAAETARWLAQLKLRQRRLVALKREELPRVADLVQPLEVPGCPTLYCLKTDVPLLQEVPGAQSSARNDQAGPDPLLLAPLDPLIYDRVVTSRLWGFDYTWEVYTPPAKRKRGYYALPVLAGTEFVGHVEPKLNRESRRVQVVSRSIRRGHKVAGALKRLAEFLHLRSNP